MNEYIIKVSEFNEDFVKYNFPNGGGGMSGLKWFPNVAIGQAWKMKCNGAKVVSCELLFDVDYPNTSESR